MQTDARAATTLSASRLQPYLCPRLQPGASQAALPGLALNHMAAAPRSALLAQLEDPWAVIMLGRIFEVTLPQTPDPDPTPTPNPTPNPSPTPTPTV